MRICALRPCFFGLEGLESGGFLHTRRRFACFCFVCGAEKEAHLSVPRFQDKCYFVFFIFAPGGTYAFFQRAFAVFLLVFLNVQLAEALYKVA